MTPALTAAINLIGGVRATAWLSLALVLGIATGVQSCRLDTAQAKQSKLGDANKKWQEVDKTNRRAIESFKRANYTWSEAARNDAKASEEALLRLQASNAQLMADKADLKSQMETLYANNPAARSWAVTGIPAGVADRLLNDVPGRKDRDR